MLTKLIRFRSGLSCAVLLTALQISCGPDLQVRSQMQDGAQSDKLSDQKSTLPPTADRSENAPAPSAINQNAQPADASAILQKVNEAREQVGVPALVLDDSLNAVASRFADDMAKREYFSHVAPDGQTEKDRLQQSGISYGWAGENIARGQQSVSEVMEGWMNSPGHRENILSPNYRKLGVASQNSSSGPIWVQEFTD